MQNYLTLFHLEFGVSDIEFVTSTSILLITFIFTWEFTAKIVVLLTAATNLLLS